MLQGRTIVIARYSLKQRKQAHPTRMVHHKRASRALFALIAVYSISITYAYLSEKKEASLPPRPRSTARSFNSRLSNLFLQANERDLSVAARPFRKRLVRRRRQKVEKNMDKKLVSRTKKYVKRLTKKKRTVHRKITRRTRPHRRVQRIIRRRVRRWRRIPKKEVQRMTRYGKKLIIYGKKLVQAGKVRKGKDLIRKAKRAVQKLKKLKIGFNLIARGKKLMKSGNKKEAKRLRRIGTNIQKSLGSTAKIQLPGYETLSEFRKVHPRMAKNPHLKLPSKKDINLLQSKYVFGKRLLARGRRLIIQGKRKKGYKLVKKTQKAMKEIKALNHGYNLIKHGMKLATEGQKKKGHKYLKDGFKIKLALGSGQRIKLPGYQTMNASRRPSQKKRPPPSSKDKKKRRRSKPKGEKKLRRFKSKGKKKRRRPSLKSKKKRRRSKPKGKKKRRRYKPKGKKKRRRSKPKGKKKRRRPGGGRKKRSSRKAAKKKFIRKLARDPKRGLTNVRKMEEFSLQLMKKAKALKKYGNSKNGESLHKKVVKALGDIKRLKKGYNMIARGEELVKKGKIPKGRFLIARGLGITTSLGAGTRIKIPGFQTMNAFRFAPTSPSHPRIARPPTKKTKDLFPTSCQCKRTAGSYNGVCYVFTDKDDNSPVRFCRKRVCRPSYVCVDGFKTGVTCIRKKVMHRTVAYGLGTCRQVASSSTIYVPYSM